MQSFILSGGTSLQRSAYLAKLSTPQTELIHLVAEKSSLTIKQVQDLNQPLSISARLPRLVWIEEANLLTIPAQNALLKMLEEPPSNTSFYLTCNSSTSLLPTIRSRCQTITLSTNNLRSTIDDLQSIKEIMSLSPGDRLIAITKRDRAESLIWITQIESALKQKLSDKSVSNSGLKTLAKIAKLTQDAHTQLLANCSVGLVTQNFYLLLPHTYTSK